MFPMLEMLKYSGLPLYLDNETNVMALMAPLVYDGYARKVVQQMDGLLYHGEGANPQEPYYDVYRGIRSPGDDELLRKNNYRYDITIIMPGQIGGECKKTSGHYHGYNAARTNTYPEVYEVIKGSAIYVLQRADHFEGAPEKLIIDDLIIAQVNEGETILIPPNYGHCSVNVGDGPLVFSNLAYVPCPIHYGPVKHYTGMACYVLRENGKTTVVPNPRYAGAPQPRYATVKQNPRLGVQFGLPVYESYRNHPGAFEFLGAVDGYEDEIMSMLSFK